MAEAIVETGTTPAPMGLLPRFVGIVTSPADTYRAVVAHPRWLGMLAIGLGVLYRRKTSPIATGLFAVYAVIALGLAAVMSRFGGGH
jgi:hypothetical protein